MVLWKWCLKVGEWGFEGGLPEAVKSSRGVLAGSRRGCRGALSSASLDWYPLDRYLQRIVTRLAANKASFRQLSLDARLVSVNIFLILDEGDLA